MVDQSTRKSLGWIRPPLNEGYTALNWFSCTPHLRDFPTRSEGVNIYRSIDTYLYACIDIYTLGDDVAGYQPPKYTFIIIIIEFFEIKALCVYSLVYKIIS